MYIFINIIMIDFMIQLIIILKNQSTIFHLSFYFLLVVDQKVKKKNKLTNHFNTYLNHAYTYFSLYFSIIILIIIIIVIIIINFYFEETYKYISVGDFDFILYINFQMNCENLIAHQYIKLKHTERERKIKEEDLKKQNNII